MAEFINTVDVLGEEILTDSIISRRVTEYKDNSITKIGTLALCHCNELVTVDCPAVTVIEGKGLNICHKLKEINLPNLERISGSYPFQECVSLTHVDLPKLATIDIASYGAFLNCGSLRRVNLPSLETLGPNTFVGNSGPAPAISFLDLPRCTLICAGAIATPTLETLILRSATVCRLDNVSALNNTKIKSGTGYIYVPAALVESYKTATNWSTYAAQFRAIEDYTIYCDSITLSASTLTFNSRESKTLTATLEPSDIVCNDVYWSSDNPNVATVSDGLVRARNNGTAVITAISGNKSASCTVSISGIEESGYPMLYSLPQARTFNGTSDYIDTGLKLFDIQRDFTIVCSATFNKLTYGKTLFSCINHNSGSNGVSADGSQQLRIRYSGLRGQIHSINPVSSVSKLVIRYVSGFLDRVTYLNTSGEIITKSDFPSSIYLYNVYNLTLGAYMNDDGTVGGYFNGTINRFDVYDAALADDEIDALLTEE